MQKSKQLLLACLVGLLLGSAAVAAPFVIPKIYAAGDAITAADRNTELSALASSINNIAAGQIGDSAITSGKLGTGSVTSDALGTNSVTAGKIDTGAIYNDTQFSPAYSMPTARLVSTSSDTIQNWIKMANGYYMGDGTDTRTIYCTQQGAGHAQGGYKIPFTVTRVEVYSVYHGVGASDGSYFLVRETTPDSVIVYIEDGVFYPALRDASATGLTHDPGTYRPIVNTSDSHGFRVRDNSTGILTANKNGYEYFFTVWGY